MPSIASKRKPATKICRSSEAKSSIWPEYVTNRWADLPEADLALDLLISFYINAGDYDKGVEILSQIKDDSPRRPDAEIKLGPGAVEQILAHDAASARAAKPASKRPVRQTAGPDDEKTKKELDALAKQSQEVSGARHRRTAESKIQVNSQTVLAALVAGAALPRPLAARESRRTCWKIRNSVRSRS